MLAALAPATPVRPEGEAAVQAEIVRLRLRHTWTTVMSSSDYRDNVHLRFTRDGATSPGEAAPIVRYDESAEGARKAIESPEGPGGRAVSHPEDQGWA
jgi:hypothetical protein